MRKILSAVLMSCVMLMFVQANASISIDFEDLATNPEYFQQTNAGYTSFYSGLYWTSIYAISNNQNTAYPTIGEVSTYISSDGGNIHVDPGKLFSVNTLTMRIPLVPNSGDNRTVTITGYSGYDSNGVRFKVYEQVFSLTRYDTLGNINDNNLILNTPNLDTLTFTSYPQLLLDNITYTPVPIPGAALLLGSGIITALAFRKKHYQ